MNSLVLLQSWLKPGMAAIAIATLLVGSLETLTPRSSDASSRPAAPAHLAQKPISKKPVASRLPKPLVNAVLRTHARQSQIPMGKLRVVSASQEQWPNACLGLEKPGEVCAEALVNGWRVEVSDGSQRWTYRTDNTGRTIRSEDINNSGSLPQAIARKVLSTAAQQAKVPVNQLKIVATRSRVWDGCLGVAGPTQPCTRIAIAGWQVIVASPQQYWVYHLNQTASQIKLNPTTSGKGTLAPTFWQPDSNWPANEIGEDVVFQSVSSGGIAGLTYKIVLQKDGQVIQTTIQGNRPSTPIVIRRLSPQQVQAFTQGLQQQEFGDFSGFNYPAPNGSADYFTVALMSPYSAVQYVDISQDQTPTKLQAIIQAWNRISSLPISF